MPFHLGSAVRGRKNPNSQNLHVHGRYSLKIKYNYNTKSIQVQLLENDLRPPQTIFFYRHICLPPGPMPLHMSIPWLQNGTEDKNTADLLTKSTQHTPAPPVPIPHASSASLQTKASKAEQGELWGHFPFPYEHKIFTPYALSKETNK